MLNLLSFGSLLGRSFQSLSVDEIREVATAMGLDGSRVNDELKSAALALLQSQSIDSVADLVQSPAAIEQLVYLVKGDGLPYLTQAGVQDEEQYKPTKPTRRYSSGVKLSRSYYG